MDRFHECRMELSVSDADQVHLALFVTDQHGQWLLLEDWSAEPENVQCTLAEVETMLDTWLQHGGRLALA